MWRWMNQLDSNDKWIFFGDWNMVELWDNAIGPSTLIHGTETRMWNKLVDQFHLVDNYLCAGSRMGPLYTRHARRAERLDQS